MDRTETPTLGELRQSRVGFSDWAHKNLPWLFRPSSLFYFFVFVFLLGLGWMAYSLLSNYGTQLYWWDYQIQYLTFTYNFWDTWHHFLRTGAFEFYSTGTYLGTDNIGSNAYYGLFDPFLTLCYLFPRAWIPQTFALATVAKGMVSAAAMRAYLKSMGVSEKAARLGAVAFAFNGYVTFMEGFPTFVSMAFTVPLVMLGVERLIKEKKPGVLIAGLFFIGIISFFFLVVVCIWGVIYALWRYFWTIKKRKAKDNFVVMALGVFGFAVGILTSAWVLLPSLRETSLSGRTASIGSAYLASLVGAFKNQDFGTVFGRLFELVGDSPGRELQPLVGFFYPTCNYLYLPLMQSGYDSWTASLFSYTPIVILFFIALIGSIRRKEYSRLIAFALSAYLLFTDFAYFFFYAFSGDGYGRWYIVLMPLIIYFACQEFDRLKEEPTWVVTSGALSALGMAALTWILCITVLDGKNFSIDQTGPYWQTRYTVPATYNWGGTTYSLLWEVYYELALDAAVGVLFLLFRRKDWLYKALIGFVALETVVSGNLSFIYGSSCSYATGYNGGSSFAGEATSLWSNIHSLDGDSYYRAYMDGLPDSNSQEAFGYNGTSTFHSLFNYDLAPLARYSHMTDMERPGEKFDATYYNKSWAGYYGNKRFDFDLALSMKYYALRNEGYGEWEPSALNADNVPFGSTLFYGNSTTPFRVYQNSAVARIPLGHAVDHLYAAGSHPTLDNPDADDFYSGSVGASELLRNEEVYLDGAIVADSDLAAVLEASPTANGQTLAVEPAPAYSATSMSAVPYKRYLYTNTYDWWGPTDETGRHLGPTYFLQDPHTLITSPTNASYVADKDKYVLAPVSGTYFNDDPSGAYFVLKYPTDDYAISVRSEKRTRVFFIGDTFDGEGNVTASDVMLTYEYHTIASYIDRKVGYGGDVYGFYPAGRVKYIAFCAKNSDLQKAVFPTSTAVYMEERSALEGEVDKLASPDYNLQHVTYATDRFTFDTAFAAPRLVVTSLGYDAGWTLTATSRGGLVSHPVVYRLDGGFAGFVAPAGDVSYVLSYQTPYFNLGLGLAGAGILSFGLYEGLYYYFKRKKEKTEDSTTVT